MKKTNYIAIIAGLLASTAIDSQALALRYEIPGTATSNTVFDNGLGDTASDANEISAFAFPFGGFHGVQIAAEGADGADTQMDLQLQGLFGDGNRLRIWLTDDFSSSGPTTFKLGNVGGKEPLETSTIFSLYLGDLPFATTTLIGRIEADPNGDPNYNYTGLSKIISSAATGSYITWVADIEGLGANIQNTRFNALVSWSVPDGGATGGLLGLGVLALGLARHQLRR